MTTNPQDDFQPNSLFKRAMERWNRILLAACLGGLIGLGLSFLRTPVYEATAILGIGIDYSRALPLDDDAEGHAYSRVRDLLLSEDAILPVLLPDDRERTDALVDEVVRDFRSRIRLDQIGTRWELTVFDQSPEEASLAANVWAEKALALLTEAQQHAVRAIDLQSSFYRISCRLEAGQDSTDRAVLVCDALEPTVNPDDLTEGLIQEVNLSRGILPALSASFVTRATTSADPIIGGRGILILAGVFFGFLLSFGWQLRR
jgi:hypothetical protein